MKRAIVSLAFLSIFVFGCAENPTKTVAPSSDPAEEATFAINAEPYASARTLVEELPTIGVMMFNDVLMTEVTAPIDVFSKTSEEGRQMFNVITIARDLQPIVCESGLRILPDFTFDNCPELDVLVVPSSYDMTETVKDAGIVDFIKKQNANSDYTMSNCGGAQLIGKSGIASGKKIVTWIGGGEDLQKEYPELVVQDDASVSFVEDGKFLSSNGNLASYISALELLEKMTSEKHRDFVESYLYLERLKNWKD